MNAANLPPERTRPSRSTVAGFIAVVLAPILANFFALFGLVAADPALLYGGFSRHVDWNSLSGFPTIDPTIGFGNQALGTYLATELAHGRAPWWNPFEGAGFPIGESIGIAVFFPFSLLHGLPNGIQIDRCALEITAGLATWFLLRELRVGAIGAVVGAIAFGLNGSFCWIGGDVGNVAPFLPLLILGIERLRRGAFGGWALTAASLGLSLIAGFPESAYLNGLLALAWTIVRFVQHDDRRRFATALITSAAVGLLAGTPPLIAFADFLQVAYVGGHLDGGLAREFLGPAGLPQLLLPYFWGPIGANFSQAKLWSGVGGYAGIALAVLAVASLSGRADRTMRFMLFGWIVVTIATTFDVPLVHDAVVALPLVKFTAFFRYFPTSWEFAFAILAAWSIDDLRTLDVRSAYKRYAIGIAVVASFVVLAILAARVDFGGDPAAASRDWLFQALEFGTVIALGLAIAVTIERRALRIAIVAALVLGEVWMNYAVPQRAYPRSGELDLAPIAYLREHLGYARFYTLGPIGPNYGTYYGIASINHNDLPVPRAWVDYIHSHLDPDADAVSFVGYSVVPTPGKPSRAEALRANIRGFEGAGVRFVVTQPDQNPFATIVETPHVGESASITDLQPAMTVVNRTRLRFTAAPLEAIEIYQGNYAKQADGILDVRVCDARGTCATGERALSESTDNSFFYIGMDRPALLAPSALTVTVRSRGSRHRETLWTYPRAVGSDASLSVNGVAVPNKTLAIRFQFYSPPSGTRRVYRDDVLSIYEFLQPRPYFSAPGCRLLPFERTRVEVTCAKPAELTRLELLMPGWSVDVNGAATDLRSFDDAFQRVSIPRGQSIVRFHFEPPFIRIGLAALGFATLIMLGSLVVDRRRMRVRIT